MSPSADLAGVLQLGSALSVPAALEGRAAATASNSPQLLSCRAMGWPGPAHQHRSCATVPYRLELAGVPGDGLKRIWYSTTSSKQSIGGPEGSFSTLVASETSREPSSSRRTRPEEPDVSEATASLGSGRAAPAACAAVASALTDVMADNATIANARLGLPKVGEAPIGAAEAAAPAGAPTRKRSVTTKALSRRKISSSDRRPLLFSHRSWALVSDCQVTDEGNSLGPG
jgi:hypothetical protein